jgi:hypothetical protein
MPPDVKYVNVHREEATSLRSMPRQAVEFLNRSLDL